MLAGPLSGRTVRCHSAVPCHGDDTVAAPGGGDTGVEGEGVMEFYAILDQIVHLLRSRGRVSYRALQRQFALDDALLADLKAEILYTQHPVVEDGDRGLVWTGDTSTPSAPATPPPQPATQQDTHAELPSATPHSAEAE